MNAGNTIRCVDNARRSRTATICVGRLRWGLAAVSALLWADAAFAAASGSISSQFGVDRVGAATYEVPIQLPPGTAGVAPELSFSYNSHSPDGMLGVGWSVTGLSSITRCEIRRGDQIYPITYTATDRFCLDGDYLVAEPGQVYGADGSVYRLEKQPWVRVRAIGQCPAGGSAGPCRFLAEQPSGDVFEYGTTADSAIEAIPATSAAANFPVGAIRVWAASRYINKVGNAIEFRYRENTTTGEYSPAAILYTINSRAPAPLVAQRAVAFTFEDSAPAERFQGGARVVQSQRLTEVVTCINRSGLSGCDRSVDGTQQVSRYRIEYAQSPATARELVQTITQYGSDDTALRPQRMTYQAPAANAFAPASGWSTDFTWDDGWNQPNIQERQLADINGDGRYDLIGFGLSKTEYALSTGAAFAPASSQAIFSADQGYNNNARFPRLIVDVNGDGRSDILGFGNTKVQVSLSNGTSFTAPATWSTQMTYGNGGWDNTKTIRSAADINGDGRSDIIGFGHSKVLYQLSEGDTFGSAQTLNGVFTTDAGYSTPETHPRYLADLNGDGLADIIGFKNAGIVEVALSNGSGFGPVMRWTDRFVADSGDGWVPGRNPRFVSDLNGDGLTDLIGFRNDDVIVAYSSGKSFTDPTVWTQAFTYNHGGWDDLKGTLRTLGDVDGDRLPDIIAFGNSDTSFGINRLGRFDTTTFATIKNTFGYSSIARNPRFPADTIGAGISALIGLADTQVMVALPPSPTPDLLVGVVNEIGGTVAVTYASIIDNSSVYVPASTEWTYPYRTLIGPMDVVSLHSIGDGLGGNYGYQHRYEGTVADVVEQGFLGFEATTLIDLSMNPDSAKPGVATRTEYALAFPQNGLTTSTQSSVVETGKVAGRFEYTYQTVEVLPGIFDVRKTSEHSTQYALNSDRSYQTRQTYSYDDYGNLQLLKDEGNLGDANDDSAVCVNFINLTDPWRIGFPRDSATAKSCAVTAGTCACADALTRDRWEYTDASLTNTRSHAQFDSSNNGWLGEVMEWDAYGNQVVDQGAYWTGDAGEPTLFNPLRTTFDPDYRSFPIRQANNLFATAFTYDPRFGVTTSQTDPNNVTLRYTYDGFARVLTGSGPSPAGQEVVLKRWTYTPLPVGASTTLVEMRDWSGATATSSETVDGLQRTIRTTNEVDADCVIATEQAYLAVDRVRQQSLPFYAAQAGRQCARAQAPAFTVQRYDALGRLTETVNPDGTVTDFDLDIAPLDNVQRDLVVQTDAYGTADARQFSTYLDNNQNPLRWVFPSDDAAKPVADLRYDAIGRLEQLTAPKGEFSTWTNDSLNRVTALKSANSGTQTVEYAREGMQRLQTDADGRTVAWTYDEIGRVRTETVQGAAGAESTTTFTYDQSGHAYPIGRLTSVDAPTQATQHSFDYDPYGNRQQSQLTIDGKRFAIQVDYDPLQRAVQLTYPDNAKQRKRYGTDGFLAEVSVCLTGGACADSDYVPYATYGDYTAMGGPQTLLYRDGRTSRAAFEYDTLGRVRSYTMNAGSGTALISRAFDWNRLNELLSSTDRLDELRSLVYAYDGAGYLSSATVGARRTSFGYDELGNLKQKGDVSFESVAAQVRRGVRNGQEVFSADYDASGNMVRRKHVDAQGTSREWHQSFDALGRMTSIEQSAETAGDPNVPVASFVYDFNQSLLKRIDLASETTSYYVSQNFDVAVLKDGSSVYTKYVDGLTGPVASISTNSDQLVARVPDAPADRWIAPPVADDDSGWIAGALTGSGVLSLLGLVAPRLRRVRLRTVVQSLRQAARFTGHMLLAFAVLTLQMPNQAWATGLTPGANGAGIPVAGTTLFYYNDLVRSSVLVVTPDGAPQTEILYAPYGEIDETASFGVNNFRAKFAGVELAENVGLYLNAGRYFDPAIGRFVGADTNRIGAASNNAVMLNRYAYAANNPITNIDPNGGSAQSVLFDIALAAFAVGAVLTGGGIVAVAEIGAYFGGAAVNHSYDPSDWNYKSWKTYGGMAAGIAVSEVGLAISIAAPEAIPEEAGAIATFLAGVAADAAVGFAENATYAALGGASRDEILKQGLIGAATGAAFSAVGQGISAGVGRLSSRATGAAAEAGEETSLLGSRSGAAAEHEESSFGAGCKLSSFAAGTQVATPDGLAAIDTLPLHGFVLALNEATGEAEARKITAVFERTAPAALVIVTAAGERIVTTPEHPFLIKSGWVDAARLSVGDQVFGPGATRDSIAAIEHTTSPITVYNIEVDGLHTYLVGSAGLAVHNPNYWCTSKNAKELRENMIRDGAVEPDFENSAHHIVESTDTRSKYMIKARDHLDRLGIDINDSANGVFLARSSRVQNEIDGTSAWVDAYPHSRVHTSEYKKVVWKSIKNLKTRSAVRQELRNIGWRLKSGNLPGAGIDW